MNSSSSGSIPGCSNRLRRSVISEFVLFAVKTVRKSSARRHSGGVTSADEIDLPANLREILDACAVILHQVGEQHLNHVCPALDSLMEVPDMERHDFPVGEAHIFAHGFGGKTAAGGSKLVEGVFQYSSAASVNI